MKSHRPFCLALLILVLAANASATDEVKPGFPIPDTPAGASVNIPGTFPGDTVRQVRLKNTQPDGPTPEPIAATVKDGNVLSFALPTNLKSGRYIVNVELGEATIVAGELRVPAAAEVAVTVTAARPVSPYPNPNPIPNPSPSPPPDPAASPTPIPNQYNFEIAGTNFSPVLENNHIEIDDVPIQTPRCSKTSSIPCLSAEDGNETRKLIVYHYSPPTFSRPLTVAVRVGDNVAKAPKALVFSSISERLLRVYALGAFAVLIGILYLLVRTGIRVGKINREKYGSLSAFLLDRETNSYSLSKFQLTLFTLVTVFGYIYVFVCTLWVQWRLELPPVPEGLPGMMAVSVGTTVVAAGIGAKIGGKGAGPMSPSLSDFITSGGVVLPERFQFFLWTIISSVGVLVLILASDPVTVTELPKLPDGMLYLMGLSSAGYLGGKLVRGPGPSITSLDAAKVNIPEKAAEGTNPARPATVGIQMTVSGDNLGADATFQLDDQRIPADQVEIVDRKVEGQDARFCSMLKVQLRDVAEKYFDGPHVFRIVNQDTQGADFRYGAIIDSAGKNEAGNLRVTGINFKDPSSAIWTPSGGQPDDLGVAAVTKKSDTELEVALKPGTAGEGTITIKSPGDLTTSFKVNLGAGANEPGANEPGANEPEENDPGNIGNRT